MNTKSALRTALAAVAAGALVLGSAGAATAKPDKAKKAGKQEYLQLKMVDVHNGFLNVHPDAEHRDIKVKALVRNTVKDMVDPATVTVTLTHYAAKGTPLTAPETPLYEETVTLDLKSKVGKKSQKYRKVVEGDMVAASFASLAPGATAYVCLTAASVSADGVTPKDPRKQVQKKLDRKRDCFRVVNVDPKLTTSTSDDKD